MRKIYLFQSTSNKYKSISYKYIRTHARVLESNKIFVFNTYPKMKAKERFKDLK